MAKPKLVIIPVTPFQQNCTLMWNTETMRGAVTDPGGDVDRILEAVKQQGVTVEKILLTHGHIDHAGGAAELKEKTGASVEGPHRNDAFMLAKLAATGAEYGYLARPVTPDRWLNEGDTVEVAGLTFSILECPGHSPGSVVFYNAEHRFCLMGDVLFDGSIGRTDFPYGDHALLISGIKTKLLPLGDDVSFIPGHGRPSTIGKERTSNPYLT